MVDGSGGSVGRSFGRLVGRLALALAWNVLSVKSEYIRTWWWFGGAEQRRTARVRCARPENTYLVRFFFFADESLETLRASQLV